MPTPGSTPRNGIISDELQSAALRGLRVPDPSWSNTDLYLEKCLLHPDPGLEDTLRESRAAGLPPIQVSPLQGKLLHLLVRAIGARRVLEVGTLGGYSAIWIASALPPDGLLTTLEVDARHAQVAQRNFQRAGLGARVDLLVGPALENLPKLHEERAGPFDLVFIDADKPNNPAYFEWALRLARPGALVLVDNVVREGKVLDEASADPSVRGTRALLEQMGRDPRVLATALQTVGSKGHDGFAAAWVLPHMEASRGPTRSFKS